MWQKEFSFSRVRVTRAHSLATLHFCFHNLHINEPLHVTSFLRRSCSLEKFKAEISILNTLIFCQFLKNVRKVSISVCVIVYYNEICEDCESKKVKIPITYARARNVMTKKRIAKGCKWRNITNHGHEKMSEKPQKKSHVFQKTWEIF